MSVRMESNVRVVKNALTENIRKGLTAGAFAIHGAAVKLTPVDTGRLRASLAWAVDGEQREHTGTAKGSDGTTVTVSYVVNAPKNKALIGTNVEYAVWVHEDPQLRVPREGGVGQRKFLETAARQKKARVKTLMRKALRGEL